MKEVQFRVPFDEEFRVPFDEALVYFLRKSARFEGSGPRIAHERHVQFGSRSKCFEGF